MGGGRGGEVEWMADFGASTRESQKIKVLCASSSRATPKMTRLKKFVLKSDKSMRSGCVWYCRPTRDLLYSHRYCCIKRPRLLDPTLAAHSTQTTLVRQVLMA